MARPRLAGALRHRRAALLVAGRNELVEIRRYAYHPKEFCAASEMRGITAPPLTPARERDQRRPW